MIGCDSVERDSNTNDNRRGGLVWADGSESIEELLANNPWGPSGRNMLEPFPFKSMLKYFGNSDHMQSMVQNQYGGVDGEEMV